MKSIYMDIVKYNMLMTNELLNVLKVFEEKNIDCIPFKGPVLTKLAYGDITLRQYVDLDILIEEKYLFHAAKILNKNSYNSDKPIELLQNKKYIMSDNDYSFFTLNNIHIELHWKLFREKIAKQIDIYNHNFSNAEVTINTKSIKTLSLEIMIVYLCLHGSKHLWERIEWIVDIDKLLKVGIFDWNFILKISKELKVYNMFLLGISLSDELFDSNIPAEVRNHYLTNNKVQNLKFKMINLLNSNFMHEEKEKKIMILKFKYIMQMFDSKVEPLKYIISIIFKPTHYDIYFINIPSTFSFLYYLVRPIRIIFNSIKK